MTDWQPIETAPKDGNKILAYGIGFAGLANMGSWIVHDDKNGRKPMHAIVHWVEGWYDKEVEAGNGLYRKERVQGYAHWMPHGPHAFEPTHWMPLPVGPDGRRAAREGDWLADVSERAAARRSDEP